MEVVLTSRRAFRCLASVVLTASASGELLANTVYDVDDSLTTDYIYFPNNTTDAVWQNFIVERVVARLSTDQSPLDVPSFRLVFTSRRDLTLTKGEIIVPNPALAVNQVYGAVLFPKTGWGGIFGQMRGQGVDVQFPVPITIGQDFASFAVVTETGSFTLNTTLIFELYGELV